MNANDLTHLIQLEATRLGARIFRNNVGVGWVGKLANGYPKNGAVLLLNARPLHAGLATGSGDLIGLTNNGRFISTEIKRRDRPSKEQLAWLEMVRRQGGIACIAHSVDEFVSQLDG